jgi:hypothetical protein
VAGDASMMLAVMQMRHESAPRRQNAIATLPGRAETTSAHNAERQAKRE